MNDMRKLIEAVELNESNEVEAAEKAMSAALKAEKVKCKDRMGTLKIGKYKGRKAVCQGVRATSDGDFVRLIYVMYVMRKDGTDVLNTDAASRTFRSRDEFDWDDESKLAPPREGPGGLGHENVLGNDHNPSYQQFPG